MFRLWIKIALLCAISLSLTELSCGLFDFRPIGMIIYPDTADSILPYPNSPVKLSFDTEMEKSGTESILQISSDAGVISGDRFWKDNDLYFVPIAGWTAGIRYTMSLLGTVRSVDGRELRIEHFVSFYAMNKNAPPLLTGHYPANGASAGTENVILEFYFSCPMEKISVETGLTVDGFGNKSFEWLADDKTLKLIPDKALSPWTAYRWNLKESAKSRDGVPLPKVFSGQFTTDKDQILPKVNKVFPVLFSDGQWFPTGANIETGLGPGQGIAVEFHKAMGENVLRSLRFEPSLSGRTEILTEKSIVYIFTKDPEPEIMYTLFVSGDTKDSEGLKIGSDYRINFIPDIPHLNILSLRFDNGTIVENFSAANPVIIPIDPATGELSFSIYFSQPFGDEEKKNSALLVLLAAFFPRTLPPVALQSVHWISNDRLFMTWGGLTAENNDEAHFYKLTIPGGKNGISSGAGIYMKEDATLFLRVIK
ncbi:MAG: Ig-like domain-containing protein [Treponema sp.]|jgi:hypothetical protein|nr:Ig-like domain-containing protein [Treponema sp.]